MDGLCPFRERRLGSRDLQTVKWWQTHDMVYGLSTHTHAHTHIKTHLSRHIHSISTRPSGFHCNPLCVPHCLKRKRLKLSTCSSVEVFLSERSAVTWFCLSHWSPSYLTFSFSPFSRIVLLFFLKSLSVFPSVSWSLNPVSSH